jgi:hypothetical protein
MRVCHTNVNRAIDISCSALREVYVQLVAHMRIPAYLPPNSHDVASADEIQSLDLLRHMCTPKAAAGFAESLRMPEAAVVDAAKAMMHAMLMLTRPGELSDKRVAHVRRPYAHCHDLPLPFHLSSTCLVCRHLSEPSAYAKGTKHAMTKWFNKGGAVHGR